MSSVNEENVNALDSVNIYVRNLKDIKELKDKYNCPLSYEQFAVSERKYWTIVDLLQRIR